MENTTNTPNIYQKLNEARYLLKQKVLKGTGKNEYGGWSYVQLEDILPEITKLEHTLGIMTAITFTNECATARVINTDNPEESITFTSPMSTASLKGCHEVQNLGAVQTYLRRYLYMTIYEIVEQDVLDRTAGEGENKGKNAVEGNKASNTATKKEQAKESAENMVMPTGKYKGMKIGEINPDYLVWYSKQDGGDVKVKTAIEIVLKSQGQASGQANTTEPKIAENEVQNESLTKEEMDELPFTL